MHIFLIVALIISILLVVFALQNAEPMVVDLWFWEVESFTALVVLVSFSIGAIVGLMFVTPKILRKNSRINDLKRQIKELSKRKTEVTPRQEKDTPNDDYSD